MKFNTLRSLKTIHLLTAGAVGLAALAGCSKSNPEPSPSQACTPEENTWRRALLGMEATEKVIKRLQVDAKRVESSIVGIAYCEQAIPETSILERDEKTIISIDGELCVAIEGADHYPGSTATA
jgi:hypothetical protein